MHLVRLLALVVAVLALLPPAAHVLETPNKLKLDGPLWLSVQQSLYRGWSAFVDGPTEIGGLALTLVCFVFSGARRARALWIAAAACYAVMLIAFFLFNAPIDAALSGWTAASLPADWDSYRAKWETGHAIAAVFAAGALIFVFSARNSER
ncbi:MAG TPA: DUF1772 domain-containing protein [Rhodoblastus sp.]|nr:DUF1772 domain-containing protein [Rhodoblastus sp.]